MMNMLCGDELHQWNIPRIFVAPLGAQSDRQGGMLVTCRMIGLVWGRKRTDPKGKKKVLTRFREAVHDAERQRLQSADDATENSRTPAGTQGHEGGGEGGEGGRRGNKPTKKDEGNADDGSATKK